MTETAPLQGLACRECTVRRAAAAHVDGLVACQQAAYADELPTRLGPVFLAPYFRFLIAHSDAICLVVTGSDGVAVRAFVTGGRPGLRGRFVRRHALLLAWAMARRVLVDRRVRQRLWQILCGRGCGRKCETATPPPAPDTTAELSLICTHPSWCRRGFAAALIEAFSAECRHRGFTAIRLTAAPANTKAIALYESRGWQRVGHSGKLIHFARDLGCPGVTTPVPDTPCG